MATHCPIGFDAAGLRREVSKLYGALASDPDGDFHFHHGPAYAAEVLGYDAEELAALPTLSTASFAGVGNPLAMGKPAAGATVIDVGSGAGTDLLLAARAVGPGGRAIGVDMTDAMIERVGLYALRQVARIRAGRPHRGRDDHRRQRDARAHRRRRGHPELLTGALYVGGCPTAV